MLTTCYSKKFQNLRRQSVEPRRVDEEFLLGRVEYIMWVTFDSIMSLNLLMDLCIPITDLIRCACKHFNSVCTLKILYLILMLLKKYATHWITY